MFYINLNVKEHPSQTKLKFDHYYFELLLLQWGKGTKPAGHSKQCSDWVDMHDGLPELEFVFKRGSATIHWLLCLCQRLSTGRKVDNRLGLGGMQIIEAGTFDKKELTMVERSQVKNINVEIMKGEEP